MTGFLYLKDIGAFPELFLSVGILYITLFGALVTYNGTYSFPRVHLAVNATCTLLLFMVVILFWNNRLVVLDYVSFSGTIVNDHLSFFFKMLIGLSVIVYLITTRPSLKSGRNFSNFEYTILVMFATLGSFVVCFSNDLLTTYLAIEVQSLAFYIMAASKLDSSYSIESGIKYFVIGSLSSGLFLFGSSLIFGLTGSLNFDDFAVLFSWSFSTNSALLASGCLLDALLKSETDLIGCDSEFYDSDKHLQFVVDKFLMLKQHSYFSTNDAKLFRQHFYDETVTSIKDSARSDLYSRLVDEIHSNMLSDQSYSQRFLFDSRLERRDPVAPDVLMWSIFFHTWATASSRMAFLTGVEISNDADLFPESGFYDPATIAPYICVFTNGPVWLYEHGIREDLTDSAFEDVKEEHCQVWLKFINNRQDLESLINLATVGTQFTSFHELEGSQYREFYSLFDYSLVEVGLMLILLSIFLKIALAPLHLWSISVYEGSPTTSSFYFAAISKLSFFILLIRLCYSGFYSFIESWQFYCLLLAAYSIFVGSIGGIEQRKIKSLLAYSSIAHMGYSVTALSSGTLEGVQMLLCYLIIYTISGLCIWAILSNMSFQDRYLGKQNKDLGDLSNLGESNPMLAFIITICLLSMAGLPPMVGFFIKLGVLMSIISVDIYYVALALILFSVISTFYYIRIVKVIYFENSLSKLCRPENSYSQGVIAGLALILLLAFINPAVVYLPAIKASLLFY